MSTLRFHLSFTADVSFDLDQIWPDGDAPENPTAEDVARVVRAEGGVLAVLRDWGVEDHLELTISGDGTCATLSDRPRRPVR